MRSPNLQWGGRQGRHQFGLIVPRGEGEEPDEQSKRIIREEMDFHLLVLFPQEDSGPGRVQQLYLVLVPNTFDGLFGTKVFQGVKSMSLDLFRNLI